MLVSPLSLYNWMFFYDSVVQAHKSKKWTLNLFRDFHERNQIRLDNHDKIHSVP